MDIIFIPGLWLDALSWDRVLPAVEAAGHRAHPLTLPGMHMADEDRSGISLGDHVAAVVAIIDGCPDDGKVLLVAHSAGGGVAHAAVDARPDRIARVIYVGGFPASDGEPLIDGFPTDGADIPLPAWDAFDEADLVGLDEAALAEFRNRAIPSPAGLAVDPVQLRDERRFQVPITLVCPEYTSEMLQGWIERGMGPAPEVGAIRHVEYVDLPTGHWPQFTRPDDLAQCIVDRAYRPEIDEYGRLHPPGEGAEAIAALGFLEYQRATLEWKTRGLDSSGLNATTAESSLTLGGLLKHMAYVEDYWFSRWLHDRAPSAPWDQVDWSADRDWEFTSSADDTLDELLELWRTAIGRSRALTAAAIAEGGLDQPAARSSPAGDRPNLRWIVLHMIEEYARHNGTPTS